MRVQTKTLALILLALLLAGCLPQSGPPFVVVYRFGGHEWGRTLRPSAKGQEKMLHRGFLLYGEERFDDAARVFSSLVDDQEFGAEAEALLGVIAVRQRRWADAHRHLEAADKAEPDWGWPQIARVWALTQEGRYDEAEKLALQLADGRSSRVYWDTLQGVRRARYNDRVWKGTIAGFLALGVLVWLAVMHHRRLVRLQAWNSNDN